MAPQAAKSFMKDFRASFRRKKDPISKIDKAKEIEEEELAKLSELKDNYGENFPPQYSDDDILSFIRARSLNVKEAEKLLKLDASFKKLIFLDTLVRDYDVTELSKNFRVSNVIGFDKEGDLVRVVNMGYCDIKGYMHTISTIEHFKILLWFFEHDKKRLVVENKKRGRKNSKISYILDLAHLNLSDIMYKPALDTLFVALKLVQDHFHDVSKSIFIINAPPLFNSAFKVFKPVIQEYLYKQIKILGNDSYKAELLKHIDAEVLPVYLGGSRTYNDDDPTGKEMVGTGGEIPRSYYPDLFLDPEDEELIEVTVPAGSSLSFRYPITEKGTVIKFHLQAKDNDIGLGVFHDKAEMDASTKQKKKDEDVSKLEQLVPIIRSQCHLCPEEIDIVTWFTGTIVLYLDNTYSWMSSKDIAYKLTFIPPSSSEPAIVHHIRREVMRPLTGH